MNASGRSNKKLNRIRVKNVTLAEFSIMKKRPVSKIWKYMPVFTLPYRAALFRLAS